MGKLTFVQWNKHGLKGDKPFKKGAVGTGLLRAFSVTLAIFFMMGFVVALTKMPVYNFSMAIILTVMGAVAVGGASAGKAAGIRGWQHGGLVGVIFSMLFVVAGALLGVPVFDPVLITLALGVVGTIGGIVGVNLPYMRRSTVSRRYLRGR